MIALTRACQLFEGQDVNIYTDSRYAFGVIYDFGCIWQNRGFKTADNKPIANQQHVDALLKALLLPCHINVIKIRGHSYDKTEIAKGYALADKAAKEAASRSPPETNTIFFAQDFNGPDFPSVAQLQTHASPEDVTFLEQQGLTKDSNGLWLTKESVIGIPVATAPSYCLISMALATLEVNP